MKLENQLSKKALLYSALSWLSIAIVIGFLFQTTATAVQAPQGSYLQTCKNVTVANGALSASCRTKGGDWVNTSLKNYTLCISDIGNADGTLTCTKRNVPKGSYLATCLRAEVSGSTLSASCRTKNGGYYQTTLPGFNQCVGDIGNADGILTCAKGNVPKGSYLATCLRPTATGSDLSASCRAKNGGHSDTTLAGFDQCNGDIGNLDGHLTCAKGNVPQGSYLKTCVNPAANGSTLFATCRAKDGQWRATELAGYAQCIGDVSNDNGSLTCSKQIVAQNPPYYSFHFCLEESYSHESSTTSKNNYTINFSTNDKAAAYQKAQEALKKKHAEMGNNAPKWSQLYFESCGELQKQHGAKVNSVILRKPKPTIITPPQRNRR